MRGKEDGREGEEERKSALSCSKRDEYETRSLKGDKKRHMLSSCLKSYGLDCFIRNNNCDVSYIYIHTYIHTYIYIYIYIYIIFYIHVYLFQKHSFSRAFYAI